VAEKYEVVELTIHSELILAVVNKLVNILGTNKYHYNLMPYDYDLVHPRSQTWIEMSPDIIAYPDGGKPISIEVESDIQFDLDASMRQIKKYQRKYEVRVVIPKEYERFAHLYTNDGIRTYIWTANRIWECMTCGTIIKELRTIKPKCKKCKSTEQRLKGIEDFNIQEFRSTSITI
jgi:rubrerythrin